MRFSVIIPVYKVEQYISKCVESVLSQDFEDYEIILVDDGSPDNCPIICDRYAEKYSHVRVIHKENGGLSDARNAGIKASNGEYLLFIDSDDYWDREDVLSIINNKLIETAEPDVLMFQGKKYYSKSKKTIIDTPFNVRYINGHSKDEVIKHVITTQSYSMSACSKASKRSSIVDNEVFFQKGLIGEDLDWFLNLITSVDSIKASDLCCYVYRIREGSISNSSGIKSLNHQLYIINKWHKLLNSRLHNNSYKKYYLGILAYAYMVSLLHYSLLDANSKKQVYKKMKKEKPILHYAVNRKSKLAALAVDLLGIDVSASLVGYYYKKRNDL